MQIGRLAAEQATEPVMAGEGEVSEEVERLGVQRRPRVEDEEGRDSSRLPCPQEVLSTERESPLASPARMIIATAVFQFCASVNASSASSPRTSPL